VKRQIILGMDLFIGRLQMNWVVVSCLHGWALSFCILETSFQKKIKKEIS